MSRFFVFASSHCSRNRHKHFFLAPQKTINDLFFPLSCYGCDRFYFRLPGSNQFSHIRSRKETSRPFTVLFLEINQGKDSGFI